MHSSVWAAIIAGVITLFGLMFNRRKNIADARKAEAETKKLELELERLRRESEREVGKLAESTRELSQITSYHNFRDAFKELEQCVRTALESNRRDSVGNSRVSLKLIAVAMTFSWEYFIVTTVPEILANFPEARVDLDVLFIDPDFLAAQPLSDQNIDWVAKTRSRVSDARTFAAQSRRYSGRLHFRANTYRNLPHWHGWLLNEEHLFLGRTDWQFDSEGHPILRVGQNKYRHFDTSNSEGEERIRLFMSWQRYYFEFASEPLCDSARMRPGGELAAN